MNIVQGAKYIWQIPDFDHSKVAEFSATFNLSYPVIQTLLSRGLKTKLEFDQFLTSSFEKDVEGNPTTKVIYNETEKNQYTWNNNNQLLLSLQEE